MSQRQTVTAVVAADRRFDQAGAVSVAAAGKREQAMARVGPRRWLVGRAGKVGSGLATGLPRDGSAHERAQFDVIHGLSYSLADASLASRARARVLAWPQALMRDQPC